MEHLDATFTSAPLPSLSTLTGAIRPATAAAEIERSWAAASRKPRRGWTTQSEIGQTQRPQEQQFGSLREAASKQLASLRAKPAAPYSRPLTAAEQAAAEKKVVQQLTQLASALHATRKAGDGDAGASMGGGAPQGLGSATQMQEPDKPATPAALIASIRSSLSQRPGSSLSVQDLTLPRPTSRAMRDRGGAGSVSASWSGPLMPRPITSGATPLLATPPRTPTRLGSRGGLLRASAPAPLSALMVAAAGAGGRGASAGSPGAGPEVWVNPSALPPVSRAADAAAAAAAITPVSPSKAPSTVIASRSQTSPGASGLAHEKTAKELQMERLLLRSSMGNRAAADATGSAAAAAAAAAATTKLLRQTGRHTPGGLPSQMEADEAAEDVAAAAAAVAATQHARALALTGKDATAKPELGAPGNPRWGPGQPLEQFVPTRGLVYSVFTELDSADAGKLTYSMLEQAAVQIGLKAEQTRRLFEQLDPAGRGYFTVRDWGAADHARAVTDFTRLYVQATRGMAGRPMGVKEVRSAALALQVALSRLQIKNNGRSVSQARVLEAFEFIDADGSGSLSLSEVADAFNGMGIYVTHEVLDEILEKFDSNRNGTIEYSEFVSTLFPVLSRGCRE